MALAQILLRGGTSAEWLAANPILAAREMAVDTTEHRVKVGDGVSAWTSLPWSSMASSEVTRLEAAATALVGAATPADAMNETLIKDPASKTAQALTGTFVAVRTSDAKALPPGTIVVITLDKTLAQVTANPVADIADITFQTGA